MCKPLSRLTEKKKEEQIKKQNEKGRLQLGGSQK